MLKMKIFLDRNEIYLLKLKGLKINYFTNQVPD